MELLREASPQPEAARHGCPSYHPVGPSLGTGLHSLTSLIYDLPTLCFIKISRYMVTDWLLSERFTRWLGTLCDFLVPQ